MLKTAAFAATLLAANVAFANEVPASIDLNSCKVEYPKASLMNEEQGTVQLKFLVSPEGKVTDSKVEKTSGYRTLDNAALRGMQNCKFKAGTKDGVPAQTWTKIEYSWKL